MKRIVYVGTSILVTDELGDLMLEYAASLARANTSETLRFRGISENDLRTVDFSFIVGPASEIVVESIPDASVEPIDNADAMDFMRRRLAELRDRQPRHGSERAEGEGRPTIRPEPAAERSPLVDGLDI